MRMVTNRWRPDTCGCVIEFEFDADLPDDQRVHVGKKVVSACATHLAESPVTHHGKVLDENRKKNHAYVKLVEAMPDEHFVSEVDFEGNVTKRLKFEPRFSFDENRKLSFEVHAGAKKDVLFLKNELKKAFPDVDVK